MTRRRLFGPRERWPRAVEARYAAFEIAYTAVDAAAGLFFVVGSTLFLVGGMDASARILFLCGSALFLAKPLIRLARELVLLGEGETAELAARGGAHGGPAPGDAQPAKSGESPSGMADAWPGRRRSHTQSRG